MIDTPRVRKQTRHYNSFEDDELMEFSELDSDSEERPSRSRRLGDRSKRYLRAECFRVEKNLLIFGSVYLLFGQTFSFPKALYQKGLYIIKSIDLHTSIKHQYIEIIQHAYFYLALFV